MDVSTLERFLREQVHPDARVERSRPLAKRKGGEQGALKQFGYGEPQLVTYRADGRTERIVVHVVKQNAFGRERKDDRIAAAWLDYETFNELPRHAPALGLIGRTSEGQLRSLSDVVDVHVVTRFVPGAPYARDLARIADEGRLTELDQRRASALAAYLADIHADKHRAPELWRRRLRDLIGHGEGVMGLCDSYPLPSSFTSAEELRLVEQEVNRHRWRLRERHERLCQVHGDFHPFNVLFDEDDELVVLDRSRGAFGEAADDVSSMAVNYVFFSLQAHGRLTGPFEELHRIFWETYASRRDDEELLGVIQPWLAWRMLVLASPIWYPDLADEHRRRLLLFAQSVLRTDRFDPERANDYLSGA